MIHVWGLFTGFIMSKFDSIALLSFQFKYGKISSKHNGSVKKGVIFATYSSLIGESQSGGKYKTRFQQLLHWCGEDFDGVVSFTLAFSRVQNAFILGCIEVISCSERWCFLNQRSLDCVWRVSQSQKCVSNRIVQTYKNWACSVGAAEQTSQGSSCVRKCYRLVDKITFN